MNKIYHSIIAFEGIDKTGKEIVKRYVDYLGNRKYVLVDRGIISNLVYNNKIFNRNYYYDLNDFKSWLFVYLIADETDIEIRCKLTNEQKYDIKSHLNAFNSTIEELKEYGFNILTINTSHTTPYDAAQEILKYIENFNKEN